MQIFLHGAILRGLHGTFSLGGGRAVKVTADGCMAPISRTYDIRDKTPIASMQTASELKLLHANNGNLNTNAWVKDIRHHATLSGYTAFPSPQEIRAMQTTENSSMQKYCTFMLVWFTPHFI